jgi:serine/threonine protein kinase
MKFELNYQSTIDLPEVGEVSTSSASSSEDYSDILTKYSFKYVIDNYYLQVGVPQWTQGWILDLSVVYTQFSNLLDIILPIFKKHNVAFKIARNIKISRSILGGELGYAIHGKLVSIYPPNDQFAVELAKEIISVTNQFKGPDVLTDRRLTGIVYVRYGAGAQLNSNSDNGLRENYILDAQGRLIKEPFSIPFTLLRGIIWPFSSITAAEAPKKETVLQDRYRPMEVIKEDAKGSVKKGLYLEKLWRIKWCVIKEGKRNMISDSKNRDVTDRLRWQFDLHNDLKDLIPLPKVYDFFEENQDMYLVMQYIRGEALHDTISPIIHGKTWKQLPIKDRLRLINFAQQIIDIIDKMHKRGYIHRDITPANFLVDKRDKLWMIDLELSYNYGLKKPHPPFRLGTPGFMSPEQQETMQPTFEQDIYAIGAILLVILTGFMPVKFAFDTPDLLPEQLTFFIDNDHIINIITKCLSKDPTCRPSLLQLKRLLAEFRDNEQRSLPIMENEKIIESPQKDTLKHFITASLHGLANPIFMNEDLMWVSKSIQNSNLAYEQDESFEVYTDFFLGISGIIWLMAQAHSLDFDLQPCIEHYERNIDFLRKNALEHQNEITAGLYFGSIGIATAIAASINAGLLPDVPAAISEIEYHFKNKHLYGCTVAEGLAGKGLALLSVAPNMSNKYTQPLLDEIINELLHRQEIDGSWSMQSNRYKKLIKPIGFSRGVAGISCFLLCYLQKTPKHSLASNAAEKAIKWLIRKSYREKGKLKWHGGDTKKDSPPDFNDGYLGILLALIKAYEVFGDPIYRTLTNESLMAHAPLEISRDLTQSFGLVGLGEVYIEAAKVFKEDRWKQRADNIAQFLLHHFRQSKNGTYYWMPNGTPFTTAGLMTGNSGIIHFLLRCYQPEKVHHLLLPF